MKLIKTEEAVGQVLCHDITQIIPGVIKDAVFRKGHVIRPQDIPILLSVGKANLYVWENDETMLHEDEAAQILCQICQGDWMHKTPTKEGKIELIADVDGLLLVDIERLRKINGFGNMMIATRQSGYPVKAGEKLCGARIIPLIIEKELMLRAQELVGSKPLLQLVPFQKMRYATVTTGSEVYRGLIQDAFTPVLVEKMKEYGCELVAQAICDDKPEQITEQIQSFMKLDVDMILCTGGMSVDPDDRTPLAIKNAGTQIISYGAPVLPGAMFLMGYLPDGRPICGLPGCVMYSKRTVFDIVLPKLLAGIPVTQEWLAGLGHGGLCMSCPECHFPNCGFGKGI